jgi:hypothetical protein
MMRTCWEHIENKEEKQKITPTYPENEKIGLIMTACQSLPLAA